jgi:hypothetical protein
MNMFSIALIAAASVVSAKTPCEVLPMEDAQTILGQNIKQTANSAEACVYQTPRPQGTRATRLNQPPELRGSPWWTDTTGGQSGFTAKDGFAMMTEDYGQNGALIKDESGSDYSAFSVVDKSSEQIAIFILKGEKIFGIRLFGPQTASPTPDLMDKLRAVAKRAASRL